MKRALIDSASVAIILVAAADASAQQKVDYLKQIKPLLSAKCYTCHGALKQESELRLETRALMAKGAESGAIFEPGQAAGSVIVQRITADDDEELMPPPGEASRFTPSEVALIRRWIDEGANAPEEAIPGDPRDHWAFQPPVRPPVPSVKNAERLANPIDAFLAIKQEQEKLRPVGPADKRILLRRVSLDLIGLPPTREETDAFLADDSRDAYDKVVRRLLASPHYGERWGRHWMDIWRYSDWFGLGKQLRNSQKHMWHWRDWIVESLNDDKGYNRMMLEMLAADEIAPTDQQTLRATGFLARQYYLFNRTTWLDETIEHTSKAFLGLTMNCVKCHEHKYDPIPMVDYYRMRAFFEPYQVRLDALPGETDLEKNGLPRIFDAHLDVPTYVHQRGDAGNPDESKVIPPGIPDVLSFGDLGIEPVSLPPRAHNPALQPYVLEDQLRVAHSRIDAAQKALAKAKQQLVQAEKAAATVAANTTSDVATDGKPFLLDGFDEPQPEAWKTGPGEWKHSDGKLTQSKTGSARAYLRSTANHPQDFEARLKFKTLGGDKWRSVGLAFDVVDGREKMVYLSAVTPGSKLQVSYNTGTNHTYPPTGAQSRTVTLNEPYEMTISVRGPLINVSMNGQHALAYALPIGREAGVLELVAFDAIVEFDSLEVRPLPAEAKLIAAGEGAAAAQATTPAGAKAALAIAERALASATLYPATLRTSYGADVARLSVPPAGNSAALIQAAAAAARAYELAQAEEAVARSEQKLATAAEKTKGTAQKELKTAQTKRDAARKALDAPGEKYMSLRASSKALEAVTEKEDSRLAPYPTTSTGRRSALGRWLGDRRNPLTARVAVNHVWLRHFGQPLVETVTDFGLQAKQPLHHELLDWLAVEFMENNWSMKHLHSLIVSSNAYQLSSSGLGVDAVTKEADPENDYYWRRKPIRMQSQVIRDTVLHLAGVLDPTLGGATINPLQEDTRYRRSLYFTHSRDGRNKFLSMFDDADILTCYRRSESVVPQQALALANSKLALTMSRKIAARISEEHKDADDDRFIQAAFESILALQPTSDETNACREALEQTRSTLDQKAPEEATRRARENLVHALLNHNDFITVR